MEDFVAKVEDFIRRHHLIQPGDGIVIGFSGGPDSTALLVALKSLQKSWRLNLIAAHLDHGLRGEASAGDADFAAEFARRLGVKFVLHRTDVAALAQQQGTSLEAAGRQARYKFFKDVADRFGCQRIAVGHHRDDQVENVLWRLISGTGSDGLAGMRPQQGMVIRPLLPIPQQEIYDFLHNKGIAYRVDATNEETQFFRNKIRHELLPLLRSRFNRKIDEAIWRMSRLLADEADYLNQQAGALVNKAATNLPLGHWYKTSVLLEAPAPIRRRALRQIVWSLFKDDNPVRLTEGHVSALEAVVNGSQQQLFLPQGIRVSHQQGLIHFESQRLEQDTLVGILENVTLPIPGNAALWEPWGTLYTEVIPASDVSSEQLIRPGHAYLDYEALSNPQELSVRFWRPGDKMKPLGAPGTRKLQDIFVDRRIPRHLRKKLPVVTCNDDIVWVVGVVIADWAKVKPETDTVLHLWFTDGTM